MRIANPRSATLRHEAHRTDVQTEELLETVYRAFPPKDETLATQAGESQTEVVHRQAVERLHDVTWEDSMRRHLH